MLLVTVGVQRDRLRCWVSEWRSWRMRIWRCGELIEAQAEQLEELERQVASVEERKLQQEDAERVETEDGRRPQPPDRREPGLPDTRVVALEKQPSESDALGPAPPLVEEWRALRNSAVRRGSRVEQAEAAVRRWEAGD